MKKTLIGLFMLSNCMFAYSQEVVKEHEIFFVEGKTVYTNSNEEAIVIATCSEVKGGCQVDFSIKNKTEGMINMVDECFAAYYINKKGEKTDLDIYTYKKLLKKRKWNVVLFGPNNVEEVKATAEIKNEYGRTETTIEQKAQVYTGAADAAFERVENEMKGYFRKNSIMPNGDMTSYIVVKKPKNSVFSFEMKVGSKIYQYEFLLEE